MVEADDREVSIEEIAPHAKRNCRTCFGKGEISVWRMAPDGHLVRVESACMCAMRRWAKQTALAAGPSPESLQETLHAMAAEIAKPGPAPDHAWIDGEPLTSESLERAAKRHAESEFTP